MRCSDSLEDGNTVESTLANESQAIEVPRGKGPSTGVGSLDAAQLRLELGIRTLSTKGTKPQLVKRLEVALEFECEAYPHCRWKGNDPDNVEDLTCHEDTGAVMSDVCGSALAGSGAGISDFCGSSLTGRVEVMMMMSSDPIPPFCFEGSQTTVAEIVRHLKETLGTAGAVDLYLVGGSQAVDGDPLLAHSSVLSGSLMQAVFLGGGSNFVIKPAAGPGGKREGRGNFHPDRDRALIGHVMSKASLNRGRYGGESQIQQIARKLLEIDAAESNTRRGIEQGRSTGPTSPLFRVPLKLHSSLLAPVLYGEPTNMCDALEHGWKEEGPTAGTFSVVLTSRRGNAGPGEAYFYLYTPHAAIPGSLCEQVREKYVVGLVALAGHPDSVYTYFVDMRNWTTALFVDGHLVSRTVHFDVDIDWSYGGVNIFNGNNGGGFTIVDTPASVALEEAYSRPYEHDPGGQAYFRAHGKPRDGAGASLARRPELKVVTSTSLCCTFGLPPAPNVAALSSVTLPADEPDGEVDPLRLMEGGNQLVCVRVGPGWHAQGYPFFIGVAVGLSPTENAKEEELYLVWFLSPCSEGNNLCLHDHGILRGRNILPFLHVGPALMRAAVMILPQGMVDSKLKETHRSLCGLLSPHGRRLHDYGALMDGIATSPPMTQRALSIRHESLRSGSEGRDGRHDTISEFTEGQDDPVPADVGVFARASIGVTFNLVGATASPSTRPESGVRLTASGVVVSAVDGRWALYGRGGNGNIYEGNLACEGVPFKIRIPESTLSLVPDLHPDTSTEGALYSYRAAGLCTPDAATRSTIRPAAAGGGCGGSVLMLGMGGRVDATVGNLTNWIRMVDRSIVLAVVAEYKAVVYDSELNMSAVLGPWMELVANQVAAEEADTPSHLTGHWHLLFPTEMDPDEVIHDWYGSSVLSPDLRFFGGGSVRGVVKLCLVAQELDDLLDPDAECLLSDGFVPPRSAHIDHGFEGTCRRPWRPGSHGRFGTVNDLRRVSYLSHMRLVYTGAGCGDETGNRQHLEFNVELPVTRRAMGE